MQCGVRDKFSLTLLSENIFRILMSQSAIRISQVETIGDAYMVVGGCPVRIPDHAAQVATMALDLLHQSGKFKVKHLPNMPLRLRIGLHTG